MTIEDKLKSLILSKHKSLRDFCITINIPYSTLTSILKRGVGNASISNILKICRYFNISADELANGNITPISVSNIPSLTDNEKELIRKYRCLPNSGKETVDAVINIQYRTLVLNMKDNDFSLKKNKGYQDGGWVAENQKLYNKNEQP